MLLNLLQVIEFCRNAHNSISQKRKYSKENYFDAHCLPVSLMGSLLGLPKYAVIGILAHDLFEDVTPKNPKYSVEYVTKFLGEKVTKLALELTDEYIPEAYPHLNREKRKECERARLAGVSKEAKTAKICDLIHNTADITQNDPQFAVNYLKEKELLLPNLRVKGYRPNEIAYKDAAQQLSTIKINLENIRLSKALSKNIPRNRYA
jgi:hypothetical protein